MDINRRIGRAYCFIFLFSLIVSGCVKIPGKEYVTSKIEWEKDILKSSKPGAKVKLEIGTKIDLSGE